MNSINWTNVSTMQDALSTVNTPTNGWGWVGFLFMIFFIALIIMSGAGLEVALMISAFISIVLGVFLLYMNLISFGWVAFFVGLELVVFLYALWSSDRH